MKNLIVKFLKTLDGDQIYESNDSNGKTDHGESYFENYLKKFLEDNKIENKEIFLIRNKGRFSDFVLFTIDNSSAVIFNTEHELIDYFKNSLSRDKNFLKLSLSEDKSLFIVFKGIGDLNFKIEKHMSFYGLELKAMKIKKNSKSFFMRGFGSTRPDDKQVQVKIELGVFGKEKHMKKWIKYHNDKIITTFKTKELYFVIINYFKKKIKRIAIIDQKIFQANKDIEYKRQLKEDFFKDQEKSLIENLVNLGNNREKVEELLDEAFLNYFKFDNDVFTYRLRFTYSLKQKSIPLDDEGFLWDIILDDKKNDRLKIKCID